MFIDVDRAFKKKGEIHLVLGVNGQDGSYLAEELLARGYSVVGIARQSESRWVKANPNFKYYQLDLEDLSGYMTYLNHLNPSFIYHLAAVHGSFGFDYEANWISAHKINTLVVHASLEYFKKNKPSGQLIYASSSKVFDLGSNTLINEHVERKSTCIYSITKNSATELIHLYRKKYGFKSNIFWLFNHESVRRDASYFIPKVVDILRESIKDRAFSIELGNLDFWCDWGDASEYMGIICDVAEKKVNEDFILGSGQVINANNYVNELFLLYGVDPAKSIKDWKELNQKELAQPWALDLSKLANTISRVPVKSIYQISSEILGLNGA